MIVLDASAYLAYFFDEPGAEVVAMAMIEQDAVMSSVNVAEVLYKLARMGDPHTGLPADADLIAVEPFGSADAALTANLIDWADVRRLALSLGDRACLSLGHRLGAAILTADQVWATVQPSGSASTFDIELIR